MYSCVLLPVGDYSVFLEVFLNGISPLSFFVIKFYMKLFLNIPREHPGLISVKC